MCYNYVCKVKIFTKELFMLNNTKYKLTHDKELRIAFFGGSITDGSGSSDAENTSYRALVTKWFSEHYPDANIITKNSSIGGTGTALGMFRCGKDVLCFEPDLIFMEFAVNDEGDEYKNVAMQTESIIRTINKHNPDIDIITVITTAEPMIKYMENGIKAESVNAQTNVSSYYGLETVNVGDVLISRTSTTALTMKDLIPDGLHPNDDGHKIYADGLIRYITAILDNCNPETIISHALPAKLCPSSSENARLIDIRNADNLRLDGFKFKNEIKDSRFSEYIEGNNGGDNFSFTFTGTTAALYWMGGGVSCDVLVSIDGSESFIARSWDHYVRSFRKMQVARCIENLEYGLHTIKITIPNGNNDSVRFARFAGIMIA